MRFYRRSSVVGVYIRKPFWFRLNWVVAPKSFWVSTFSWLDRCSRYLLYSDLTNCLTDFRNSLNFRLRISDGWTFSFLHSIFFFLFLFFYHILQPLRHGAGYSVKTHRWSIFSSFITWCAGASSTTKQYFFSLGSWKKYIFWAFIQKRKSSWPPSTARLLYFFTNLRRAERYLAD